MTQVLNYSAENMKALDDISHIRLRYGMYIGSVEDPTHLAIEILANSIDEANLGFGNKIEIKVQKDGWVTIKDEGRGIPHGKDDEGKPIIQSVYDKLHMGGKFDTEAYANSLGQNSVGAKATNALSEILIATTVREGISETVEFKEGRLKNYTSTKVDKSLHGVEVKFLPDKTIFKDIHLNMTKFKNLLKELSYLVKGVSFILDEDGRQEIFLSKNGMVDYMNELCKDKKEIIKNRIYTQVIDGNNELEIYLSYCEDYGDKIKLFANNGANDSGTHLTAFKTTMTRLFNKFAKDNKILKDKETNLTGAELAEGQILILNLKYPGLVYDSQTKTRVDDARVSPFVNTVASEMFKNWLDENPKDAKVIIEKALEARRAREAAKKAREAVRKPAVKKGLKAKIELSEKLSDCNSKNRENCELFLVEGDSAAGSAKQGRDPNIQAIMALRGKVLNAEKTELSRLLSNKEINDIITAIGAGFKETFNIKKSRYGKIILMTDADVDGNHIDILLLTFFHKYMKDLIKQGYVYVAVPPLYRAIKGTKYIYLKDDSTLEEYKKKNSNFELQRFKG